MASLEKQIIINFNWAGFCQSEIQELKLSWRYYLCHHSHECPSLECSQWHTDQILMEEGTNEKHCGAGYEPVVSHVHHWNIQVPVTCVKFHYSVSTVKFHTWRPIDGLVGSNSSKTRQYCSHSTNRSKNGDPQSATTPPTSLKTSGRASRRKSATQGDLGSVNIWL